MREIRMLRSTRRGLETWHGRDGVTLADERARQRGTQTSTYTGAPVLDPTDERGWETGHGQRPPSYRAHPRLYQSDIGRPFKRLVLEPLWRAFLADDPGVANAALQRVRKVVL